MIINNKKGKKKKKIKKKKLGEITDPSTSRQAR